MRQRSDMRSVALHRLTNALREDQRLAGVVVVGSGATGFRDEYSDIDLVVPVLVNHDAATVFHNWKHRITDVLDVRYSAATSFTEHHHLLVLLCADGLEVDISFPSLPDLTAVTSQWRVLWQRTAEVSQRLTAPVSPDAFTAQAYSWLLNRTIHRAMYLAKALRREQPWRAVVLLDELRTRIVQLACCVHFDHMYTDALGSDGIERHVDDLPVDVLSELAQTIPTALTLVAVRGSFAICLAMLFRYTNVLDARFGVERTTPLTSLVEEHVGLYDTS